MTDIHGSARERAHAAPREGRYAEVLDTARDWLGRKPYAAEAYHVAGLALVRLGDAVEAAKSFENAEALGGGPGGAFNAGNAWQASGDRALALAAWRRAVAGHEGLGPHAVACDLGVVHASKGGFDGDWQRYADRFRAKFPALAAPQGSTHYYSARVPGPEDVLAFRRRLAELAAA